MNTEIVNAIVESYKQKGVSTHEILKDPLFLSLPLEKQVEAVQAYAGVLSAGSKRDSAGKILGKAILQGAATGAFLSVPFMAKSQGGWPARLVIGGISALTGGLTVGLPSGISLLKGEKERFEGTNKYLMKVLDKRHDVPNAVKVLDINRRYEPRTLGSIIKGLMSPEKELILTSVTPASKYLQENIDKNVDYEKGFGLN